MPPDLPETTRLSAVAASTSGIHADTVASHEDSQRHDSGGCRPQHQGVTTTHPPLGCCTKPTREGCIDMNKMFYLTPELRSTFSSVGGAHKPYQFREVLQLLKAYLYSKHVLFDPEDSLYVNCGSDPLGKALGVNRFHFNDVKSLMSKNVIPVDEELSNSGTAGQASNASNLGTGRQTVDVHSSISTTNENTTGEIDTPVTTANSQCDGKNGSPLEIPGTSRNYSPSSSCRIRRRSSGICYKFSIPNVPDTKSDSETDYSWQGYETAFCRNTEFEESDTETECFIDEYEIASDNEQDHNQSDDGDSDIEDVEVAVFAIHALHEDESEQGFWADDSQTDDQTSDSDPELVAERWDCLSCGLRNKPFVRYCGKCWQLRKDWLPERSKKRKRRKPRPKKKAKKNVGVPEQKDKQNELAVTIGTIEVNDVAGPSGTQKKEEVKALEPLKTLVGGETSSTGSLDRYGSQDSGIFMSQESLTDFTSESLTESSSRLGLESERFIKPEGKSPLSRQLSLPNSSDSTENRKSRKRRSSLSLEVELPPSKVVKTSDWTGGEDSQGCKNDDHENWSDEVLQFLHSSAGKKWFVRFLQSSSGKEWLRSSDGKLFQWSQPVQEMRMEELVGTDSSISGRCSPDFVSGLSLSCSICCLRPKNASIIHGRLSHQATCYQCARRLLNSGGRCPVCRRKIHMVCKHIIA